MPDNWKEEQEALRDLMLGSKNRWQAIRDRIDWIEMNVLHRNTPEAALKHQRELWASYAAKRKSQDSRSSG